MKVCQNCGAQVNDEVMFCPQCGGSTAAAQPQYNPNMNNQYNPNMNQYNPNMNQYNQYNPNMGYGAPMGNSFGIKPRNIVVAILLTVVTCGLYLFYWMICINDEVNKLSGEQNATSGGMVLLFAIITCGIYTWVWMYKMGERCDRIKGNNGNSGILYLLLAIFGLGIVNYCLMQDTVNKAVS